MTRELWLIVNKFHFDLTVGAQGLRPFPIELKKILNKYLGNKQENLCEIVTNHLNTAFEALKECNLQTKSNYIIICQINIS